MAGYRLYKKEKLCSVTAIDMLFSPAMRSKGGNNSIMAYPWRCIWRLNDKRHATCPKFLISVPKKRLRHAVDRVTMRRRMREAYRLTRHLIDPNLPADIAFIYVADKLTDYHAAQRSVSKFLKRIAEAAKAEASASPETSEPQ
ncbi:MAG: ribonuclease P protein component [Paramuribaculum sp.]